MERRPAPMRVLSRGLEGRKCRRRVVVVPGTE